jgi:AraC-like DNA-binding protein
MSAVRPQVVLDTEFNDMGQFGATLGWDLDFRQLEAGPLAARARVTDARNCTGIAVHFNRSFHQLGQAPGDLICFGLPGLKLGDFIWCGASVHGGSLLNFNLTAGFDSHTPRNFHGHVIAFERERLQELAGKLRLESLLDRFVQSSAAWDSPASRRLSRRLERIHPVLARVGETSDDDSAFYEEELGISILQILAGGDWRAADTNRTQHSWILKRSLDILADSEKLPVGVTELCRQVGTTLSTLNRVFTARFDVTPKAYIRARCLSAARDELAMAAPESRVADIANRWGFWHMGQFARDYRAMFGELPSETLKKSA